MTDTCHNGRVTLCPGITLLATGAAAAGIFLPGSGTFAPAVSLRPAAAST